MWTIIKFDKKKFEPLKKDISDKLGKNYKIYYPKLAIQKFKNNKLVNKEFDLLGDYLLCFHKDFNNSETLNKLKYLLGEVGVSIRKAGNFVVFHRHVFLALSHQAQALQVCILHQGNLKSQNI